MECHNPTLVLEMITGEDIDRLYEEAHAEHLHETDSARSARRTAQMMKVMDPDRMGMPALTTLLFAVCGNNHQPFDLATKLIERFMDQAEKDALEFAQKYGKQ